MTSIPSLPPRPSSGGANTDQQTSPTTTDQRTVGQAEILLLVHNATVTMYPFAASKSTSASTASDLLAHVAATQGSLRARGTLECYSLELHPPTPTDSTLGVTMLSVPGAGAYITGNADEDTFQLPLSADLNVVRAGSDSDAFLVPVPSAGCVFRISVASPDPAEAQALADLLGHYTALNEPSATYRNTVALVGASGQVVGTLADSVHLDTHLVNPDAKGPVVVSQVPAATPEAPIQWTVAEPPAGAAAGAAAPGQPGDQSFEAKLVSTSEMLGEWMIQGAGIVSSGILRGSVAVKNAGWVTPNATPMVLTPKAKGNIETAKSVSEVAVKGASSPSSLRELAHHVPPRTVSSDELAMYLSGGGASTATTAGDGSRALTRISNPLALDTIEDSSTSTALLSRGLTTVSSTVGSLRALFPLLVLVFSHELSHLRTYPWRASAAAVSRDVFQSKHLFLRPTSPLRQLPYMQVTYLVALLALTQLYLLVATGAILSGAVTVAAAVGSAVAGKLQSDGRGGAVPNNSTRAKTVKLTSALIRSLAVLGDRASTAGRTVLRATGQGAAELIEHKYGSEAGQAAREVTSVAENMWIVYFDSKGFKRMVLVTGAKTTVHELAGKDKKSATSSSSTTLASTTTTSTKAVVAGTPATTATTQTTTSTVTTGPAPAGTDPALLASQAMTYAATTAPKVAAAVQQHAPKVAAAVVEHGPRVAAAVASGAWALWSKVGEQLAQAQAAQAQQQQQQGGAAGAPAVPPRPMSAAAPVPAAMGAKQ